MREKFLEVLNKIFANCYAQRVLHKRIKFFQNNNGFTLAEVLATLAIIGVVAALTIPTLMSSIENAGTAAKVKKYNTLLNDAVKMYAVDNDCIGNLAGCGAWVTITSTGPGYQLVWNSLKPYLKLAKDCNIDTGEGCWAPGVTYKQLCGLDTETFDERPYGKGILVDGASIYVSDFSGNCSYKKTGTTNPIFFNTCGGIVIDVNGHKGPNKVGRDVFYWVVVNNGIVYPVGTSGSGVTGCDPTDTSGTPAGSGKGCTAKVIMEGKVNY